MAKRGRRVLRARPDEREDDSLLVRSAESLGRVIGSLQRQVQGTSKRVSLLADDALKAVPELPRLNDVFGTAERSSRKRSGKRATGTRKSKKNARTGGTRPSAAARKTSGSRKRSGSRKSSKKR